MLTHHSTAGIAPTEVLESQSWAYLVLDKKDCDAVLAVDMATGFEPVSEALQRLVESSMSGQRLFGSCWKELVAELLKKEVLKAKKELLAATHVNHELLSTIKQAAGDRIAQISTLHLLPSRRQAPVEYQDLTLMMVTRSAAEYVHLQLQATLRCMAVSCGALQALPCEEVGKESQGKKDFIDRELIVHAANCRRFFHDLVSAEDKVDGDVVLVTLSPSLILWGPGSAETLGAFGT